MSILPKIVVAEYPRSGGSWVTSMLGDALQLPKRDIYVGEDYEVFDVRKHPWYEGVSNLALTELCDQEPRTAKFAFDLLPSSIHSPGP